MIYAGLRKIRCGFECLAGGKSASRSANKRKIMKRRKLLKKIISGSKNIRFSDMVNLVRGFGFKLSRT